MNIIYNEEHKKWFLIVQNCDLTKEWDIVGYGETKEDAYKMALQAHIEVLKNCKRTIESVGATISDRGDFCINRECEVDFIYFETQPEDPKEGDTREMTSFAHFMKEGENFVPYFC